MKNGGLTLLDITADDIIETYVINNVNHYQHAHLNSLQPTKASIVIHGWLKLGVPHVRPTMQTL